jgi:hypothetical protein
MISGDFTTINPTMGLTETSFQFQNGVTLPDPVVPKIEGHVWDSAYFVLGSGSTAGGEVKITDFPGVGSERIDILGIASWTISNPGQIQIDSPTSATATANLMLDSVNQSLKDVDFTQMAMAMMVFQIDGIHITGPLGEPPGSLGQLYATWGQGGVTAHYQIIGTSPEPGSFVLAASGAMFLAGIRLLKRRRTA